MSDLSRPARYHGLLRALHWLLAVLILMQLVVGNFALAPLPNDANKIIPLQGHVSVGLLIGALMVLRIVTRLATRKPAPATAGNALFNGLRRLTHFLFYAVVLSMVSTGVGIALMAKLFPVLFGPGGDLPPSFDAFEPLKGHQFFATVLVVLIVLHLAGVAYHQLVLKDGLLSRMGFGSRGGKDAARRGTGA
jgi:cytochrome b561